MDVPDSVGVASSSSTTQGTTDTRNKLKDDGLFSGRKEKDRIQGRIKTYVGWTGLVSPVQLAIAGFEFTGERDLVICLVCNLKFYNWKKDMKPLDVHRQFSPHCLFLKRWYPVGEAQKGIEVKESGYESSKAKHQVFVAFVKRVASFANWPLKGKEQSPQNMAIAGFFYLGSLDRVECFYCGLVLRDWDQDDNPVSAHKQWSPTCAYVLHISQGGSVKTSDVTDNAVTTSNSAASMPLLTPRSLPASRALVASASAAITATAASYFRTPGKSSTSILGPLTSVPRPEPASTTSASALGSRGRDSSSPSAIGSVTPLPLTFVFGTTNQTSQITTSGSALSSGFVKSQNYLAGRSRVQSSSTKQTDVPNRHPPMIQALLDWGYDVHAIQRGMKKHRDRTGTEVKNASELLRVLIED